MGSVALLQGLPARTALAAEMPEWMLQIRGPVPATGDDSHLIFLIGLVVIGLAGILISVRILTKKRREDSENSEDSEE